MNHYTEDSFAFAEEIKSVSLHNKFFVSYDATSLFTNILLKETVELALTLLLEKEPNLRISKNDLKSYLKLVLVRQILYLKTSFMAR